MGGCRCAYKNCTLRTDGVTHMFHFPVFDKVRCHQWLTNAEKLEFLNLKVSQLKNRVICQHHFKPDNFMNFRKDKLTFDAVPTEDGPYCDTSQLSDKTTTQDDSKLYTISLEDIENEYLTFNDKKANFSVKYGDFLTNCDMMDLDSFNLPIDNSQILQKNKYDYEDKSEIILNDNIDQVNAGTCVFINNGKGMRENSESEQNRVWVQASDNIKQKSDNIYTIQMNEKPNEVDKMPASLILELDKMPVSCITKSVPNIHQGKKYVSGKSLLKKAKEHPRKKSGKSMAKDKKVTILNEEKISEPVPIPDNLELVSPNTILPLPNKKKNLNANLTDHNNMHDSREFVSSEPVELDPNTFLNQVIDIGNDINNVNALRTADTLHNLSSLRQTPNTSKTNGKTIKIEVPSYVSNNVRTRVNTKKSNSLLRNNKLPPEKKAAIEEKRKFNIKLRDIITSCLDKLDDQEDKDYSGKFKSQIEQNLPQKVNTYLNKEPKLPSIQDYTVAYLEARMKRMENILLNKIDQNTQRIVELKQSLSPAPKKKAAHTQTAVNEEVQKKQLYQEISKYLSPEANSLLYEELFINRFVQKIPKSAPAKKRRHR